MSPSHTVPIQFVRRALLTAQHRRMDVSELLRDAGISQDLAENSRTRVTTEQAARITRRLWQLTDDELFGLGPQPVPRGTFRLVFMALIHSADLRTALGRLAEYSRVLPGTPPITASMGETVTRLELDTSKLDDPEHLATDMMLAVEHRIVGWLVGKRIKLRSLELPYPEPPQVEDYEVIFGCLPTFDAESAAISFHSSVLSAPILRNEADLIDYIDNSPADLLARRDYGSTLSDRVRRILERGLTGDWPTSEDVAARLSLSVQHVRRKLREEGTSVSQIREEIVRDAAIASLVRGDEPVDELSERLGFSEPSAFRRAFRRWTGSPPGAYRPHRSDGHPG